MIRRLFASALLLLALPALAAGQDPHAGHAQPTEPAKPAPVKPPAEDHSAHNMGADQPKEPIPPITDADRAAAFPPDVHGHATHDSALNWFVLFDQLEWRGGGDGGLTLENKSWIGGDINRVWIRAEAESGDGDLEFAHAHLLYGRSIWRWWDLVGGTRIDVKPGPAQAWAAVGIQGLAPYWFEVEATGYVGPGGRTQARFEVEYELLFTNRLILQPLLEVDVNGKSDPERGLGSGLSSLETGLRLRYELRRELAPYVGVTWERKMFGTADFARAHGDDVSRVRVAVGLRTWF